jgi:hypothetical protein
MILLNKFKGILIRFFRVLLFPVMILVLAFPPFWVLMIPYYILTGRGLMTDLINFVTNDYS